MPMIARLFIILIFIILSSGTLSAITVTADLGDAALNAALKTRIETEVMDQIVQYSSMPDFARGFGNANTYASQAATIRGYQGYDFFTVALGTMVSLQAPNEDPLFFTKIMDDLKLGDVYTGVGVTPWAVQGGINMSFLLPGLYLSGKFGKLNYKSGTTIGYKSLSYTPELSDLDIDYNTNLYGLSVNYQLFREKSILAGILLWRGVSIQPGFIYSGSVINFKYKIETQEVQSDPVGPYTFTAEVDPSVDFKLSVKSYIIPVEVYSSMRLLYFFNFGVGGGIDYVPGGKTDMSVLGAGGITITDDNAGGASGYVGRTGSIVVDGGTKNVKADKYRLRLMLNLGLTTGPVFIDFPFTYYFTDSGYVVGVSVGAAW